ncbi:MAG: xylose isomerase [Sphingobium sp.]|nr:xylose isomerase [Sphingobium sp.]
MQLSLDHISVTDTTPSRLADIAAATGCSGICPFLHSMAVLPAMPDYDLVTDAAERRATRAALAAGGLTVDLVYPFTLARRTVVADFEPALAVAAELGGRLANVLCYDRDLARQIDRLSELADLAGQYSIGLAIEFYPPSQIRTLADALATVERLGRDDVGVTVDLLHIMRGGEAGSSMALLAVPHIRMAQISDGPATLSADRIEWEAGLQRQLPGEGHFDIPAFLTALHRDIPISVEAPQQAAMAAGVPALERARGAVAATKAMMIKDNRRV